MAVESGVAVLTVADREPGLPEDGLAHAFDRSWRADGGHASPSRLPVPVTSVNPPAPAVAALSTG